MTLGRKQDRSPVSRPDAVVPHKRPVARVRHILKRLPWRYAGPVLSVGLFAGALVVLASLLRGVEVAKVEMAFTTTPFMAVALSILCTFMSYLALTGYDGLALRQIGATDTRYSTAAIGSFTSYAISYTLGVPLLTAGAVRYRVYGSAGLSAPQIAALTLVCTLTFWLGMGAVLAAGLLLVPASLTAIDRLPASINMAIGLAIFGVIAAYLAYVSTGRRVVAIQGWSMPLPGGRVTAMQILLGVFDVCAGAAALYMLLPDGVEVQFFTFMVIYVLAAFLGVLSHAPGGIGVFETTMLIALPGIAYDDLLGRIILYRVIYYFIPFALALVILGAYEFSQRRHHVGRLAQQIAGIMKPLAPILLSGAVFLSGAGLLLTGSLPAMRLHRAFSETVLPWQLLELMHLLAALAGVCLLFLARGLVRRVEQAWFAAAAVLLLAIIATFVRSADWRLTGALCGVFMVLALGRSAFPRQARQYGVDFSPVLLGSVVAVLSVMVWIGSSAFSSVDYNSSLWSLFGYGAEASRVMRSDSLAIVATIVIAVITFIRRTRIALVSASLLDLSALLASSANADAQLALAPGQTVLASEDGSAAMVVARCGASFVALGDPLGPPEKVQEILWTFTERAEQDGLWPVIISATPQLRSLYLDAGLVLTPLGDKAWLDLATLPEEPYRGAAAVFAWGDANALSLDLVPPGATAGYLAALHAISTAWLADNARAEGHFALGRFTPDWIMANECAILRKAGDIVGFAVVLRGGDNTEWSVDILRYRPDLGRNASDFMLMRLMRLARARGVRRFDLGLTPDPASGMLPGPDLRSVTPLLFGYGDHINDFVSLRAFKARFSPQFEPRYLACTAGFALPHILRDISALVEQQPDTENAASDGHREAGT